MSFSYAKMPRVAVTCPRWEDIPEGPLIEIANRTHHYEDFYNVKYEICTAWSLTLKDHSFQNDTQIPLLLRADYDETTGIIRRRFFSPRSQRFLSKIDLAALNDNDVQACYSSRGWLLVVSSDSSMFLFNPFSSSTVALPTLEHSTVNSFSVSTSPSLTDSYTVFVVFSKSPNYKIEILETAFWRPDGLVWTRICFPFHTTVNNFPEASVYIDSYRTTHHSHMVNSQKDKKDYVATYIDTNPHYGLLHEKMDPLKQGYVLDLSVKLKSVVIIKSHLKRFRVIEVKVEEDGSGHTKREYEVKSLENASLFVGNNGEPLMIEVDEGSSHNVHSYKIKPNCIYFTGDYYNTKDLVKDGSANFVVYDMANGNIEPDGISARPSSFDGQTKAAHLWVEPRI